MDDKEKSEKKRGRKRTAEMMRRFIPYYKPYKTTMFLDLIAAALTTLCELTLPMIVRELTNSATGDTGTLTLQLIFTMGGIYIFLRLIDTGANYYMASQGHIMGTRIETDLRRDLFSHLQKLSFSYYNDAKVGVIMSRITNDLFDITEFAHHGPEEIFICGIKIIGSFIVLSFVNIPLTLIIFAMIPIMVLCLKKYFGLMRSGFRESRKKIGELNAQVEDSLLGIHVVKAFNGEETEISKFGKGNHAFFAVKKKVYKIMGAYSSVTRLFHGLMYIITVVVGAVFIYYKSINSADLIAYLLYVGTLLTSVKTIVDFTEQFNRGLTGIERFCEIMDIEPDVKDVANAVDIGEVQGAVSFKNVTFSYEEGGGNVLQDFSLDVKKGESIAVVGPSGAGKTTLCCLLPRFYELTGGSIEIDGKNIKDVTLSSLRRNIGIVEQDVYLFSGTVLENILYGNPESSEDEVIAAARLAGAHEFIEALPDGYNTHVGERGVKLSGGQKQRISIARVFLKNPPVLVLDEATSALDNESERLVQKSLETLARGRTTFTIAHRLTTIKNADRIIVLTEDGLAEQGSHAELIKKNSIYASLYALYTAE